MQAEEKDGFEELHARALEHLDEPVPEEVETAERLRSRFLDAIDSPSPEVRGLGEDTPNPRRRLSIQVLAGLAAAALLWLIVGRPGPSSYRELLANAKIAALHPGAMPSDPLASDVFETFVGDLGSTRGTSDSEFRILYPRKGAITEVRPRIRVHLPASIGAGTWSCPVGSGKRIQPM